MALHWTRIPLILLHRLKVRQHELFSPVGLVTRGFAWLCQTDTRWSSTSYPSVSFVVMLAAMKRKPPSHRVALRLGIHEGI